MSQNSGNSQTIFVRMMVKVKEFTDSVKTAMDAGVKIINVQAGNIQNALKKAFGGNTAQAATKGIDALTASLKLAIKQYDELRAAAKSVGWTQAGKEASASADQIKAALTEIKRLMLETGVTAQQAGMQLIATGQAEVNAVQNALGAESKRVLTINELIKAVRQLGESVKKTTQTTEDDTKQTNENAKAKKNAADAAQKFGNSINGVVKGVTTLLSALGIITSLQGIINFFKDATKAALNFAQSQFTLSVQLGALQKAVGTIAGGSLAEWQARIKDLRKELRVFSEADITKAVSQVLVLTRSYGLTIDQQQQLIEISAALAKTTGKDLTEANDDLVKALGGSGVVLDKYGINLRDADKAAAAFQLGFTEKLQRGTDSLNAQQLALATLKAVADKTEPIIASLAESQGGLAIQTQEAEADIQDATIRLGNNFQQIALGIQNVYASVLNALADLLNSPAAKALDAFFAKYNQFASKERTLGNEGLGIGQAPQLETFGLANPILGGGINRQNIIDRMIESGKLDERAISSILGIPTTVEQYKAQRQFIAALRKFVDERNAVLHEAAQQALLEQRHGEQTEGGAGAVFPGAALATKDSGAIDPEKAAKFGEKVIDLYHKFNDDLRDLSRQRTDDLKKANADYIKELADLSKKTERKLLDLETTLRRKGEDLERDYQRDLEKTDEEESRKREEILQETSTKKTEITEDYYRKLKELDDQYYFDLQDAVAENDAVAIKKLERKYNLDRQKLDDNLADQLNAEDTSVEDRLQQLEEETSRRREELERRHQQELEDLQLYAERQREDLQEEHDRELADLNQALQDKRRQIEDSYEMESELRREKYNEQIRDLESSLAIELELTGNQLRQLAAQYEEFYGQDGIIPMILHDFYNRMAELAGNNPANMSVRDMLDLLNGNIPTTGTTGGGGTTSGGGGGGSGPQKMLQVVVSGDGTLSEQVENRILDKIAVSISDVIIRRNGQVYQ
jgi:hypothetical protein